MGLTDVRLTTRYSPDDLNSLFTAMHECGHGLYERGADPALARTPLCSGASYALHESQSRLWENIVGRSLPFWRWFYPRVQESFPDILGDVPLEDFHAAINRPHRSVHPRRRGRDELRAARHPPLRARAGAARRAARGRRSSPTPGTPASTELMGLEVPNDAVGVLQDSHWANGYFGYFPTYLLGSVLSVQIWEKAREALPDVEEQIERGEFADLHDWLRENLYALGSKFTPAETIERVVGGPIDPEPYLHYLRDKLNALATA